MPKPFSSGRYGLPAPDDPRRGCQYFVGSCPPDSRVGRLREDDRPPNAIHLLYGISMQIAAVLPDEQVDELDHLVPEQFSSRAEVFERRSPHG